MTVYAINYRNRLNEMKNEIIQKYGFEHNRTIAFFREVEKREDHPCYQNREFLEQLFKGWMK
jgi:hypothetical protein